MLPHLDGGLSADLTRLIGPSVCGRRCIIETLALRARALARSLGNGLYRTSVSIAERLIRKTRATFNGICLQLRHEICYVTARGAITLYDGRVYRATGSRIYMPRISKKP